MIIRWLGAFGKSGDLQNSLDFESTRQLSNEVAAEPISGNQGHITHARIGLLVANSAIIKLFNGDCFSVKTENGQLKKTRNPRESLCDSEAWVHPVYLGIVIKGGLRTFKPAIKKIIKNSGLKIFKLTTKGELLEIK